MTTTAAVEQYDVVETIGKGTFGTVSKIKRKADGRVCFRLMKVLINRPLYGKK